MSSEYSEISVPAEVERLLPPERIAKLKQAFAKVDRNHDGKIDLEEYLDDLLTQQRENLAKKFAALDLDRDGYLSFEEYVTATEPHYPLLKRFQDFDANQNGLLNIEEALQIAQEFSFPINREWLEQLIKVDHNGKQKISYNEYLGALTRFGFQ